ncbi:tripartite tricarboxylate transporter substrate binding protein [Bradyrhizobium sp. KBS0727]|uniref:Bug family tripartite tricarboxylate transporter substrate binding protein n=1 Tax=unclassified Bradyrhizobium TaxID=2631580 RepID=UPI00110F06ED|nr:MULTISPECIES: tripartite tricarboxylate transporter substrate binding protein [unclassified Bradyrhizobium]QDW39888.1 tripartite tricarboxylate transporter substrate binding protein [Bradyrhizobium sp. KBS0725]QDW46491.1 tripartite tricarboxylate transporter substrate binding protein [Bradyrhizobium sp. KBS0727]
MRKLVLVTIALLLFGSVGSRSSVAEIPGGAIRIIVPFSAGGPTEVLARVVGRLLGEKLGVRTYVENKPGASGMVGTEQVAKAPADGTVLLLTATHHVITPSIYKNLPYDTRKDFSPIAMVAAAPNAILVSNSVPAESVGELIAMLKKEPGKYPFGSSGTGGSNHLSGELFKQMAGVDIFHVPYKGNGPAMNDLIGGHIPLLFDSLPTVINAAKGGLVRVLAVTGLKRSSLLPDVPTLDESGVKGFNVEVWFAVFMPQANGSPVYKRLVAVMKEINESPVTREKFAELGVEPSQLVGEEFTGFVDSKIRRWSEVVARANITPE